MTHQQIYLFLSVAKHLNFTKAAAENHISQPTASRQIAQLEEEWGITLFYRTQNTVQLTPAGRALVDNLTQTVQQFQALLAALKASPEPLTGTLFVGFLAYLNIDIFVYPLLTEFTKRYPQIMLKTDKAPFPDMAAGLDTGLYDVVFAHDIDLPFVSETVNHIPCHPLSHVFVMSSSHPLATKEDLQLSDLSGETFLLQQVPWRANRETLLRSVCKQFHIEDLHFQEAYNMEEILFAVRAGRGIALIHSDNPCLCDNRYFSIPVPNTDAKSSICALYSSNNNNPATPLFMQLVKEHVALGK